MRKIAVLLPILFILCIPWLVRAGHVQDHVTGKITTCSEGLSWDANTEADMAEYFVYVGRVSGSYNIPVAVPHTTATRIVTPCSQAGIVDDGQYYFAVSAVDFSGNESIISNEFAFFLDRPPAPTTGLDVN